jgi:hypothetical protein
LLSFFSPLHFVLSVSGFFFGTVLAVPSVPQGCLGGPVGVLLRAVRGARQGHRTPVMAGRRADFGAFPVEARSW